MAKIILKAKPTQNVRELKKIKNVADKETKPLDGFKEAFQKNLFA